MLTVSSFEVLEDTEGRKLDSDRVTEQPGFVQTVLEYKELNSIA